MKTFVKMIFYLNFLLTGGAFMFSFCQFVLYNGFGNMFEYKTAEYFVINRDTVPEPSKLIYEYVANGKKYHSFQYFSPDIAKSADLSKFNVIYNTTFKNISVIKESNSQGIRIQGQVILMIIFGAAFLLMFLIYRFADLDKWIRIYTGEEYRRRKEMKQKQ
ncbi:hypothetical protein [Coprobacter sp.]